MWKYFIYGILIIVAAYFVLGLIYFASPLILFYLIVRAFKKLKLKKTKKEEKNDVETWEVSKEIFRGGKWIINNKVNANSDN